MSNTLSLNNVTVYLNKNLILQDISFELHEGEILTVVGPSGSGKSTLLNIIGGINKHYSGEILFRNKPIKNLVRGYIPQNLGLLPWKKVRENIDFVFATNKVNSIKVFATDYIELSEVEDEGVYYLFQISDNKILSFTTKKKYIHHPVRASRLKI